MYSKKSNSLSRRNAIKTIGLLGSGMFISPTLSATPMQTGKKRKSLNKELGVLSIGVRKRGLAVAMGASNYGKMVACCDVDTAVFGAFQKKLASYQDSVPVYYIDYRQALERKDVDIVTIGTPDHWHALMIIDAIEAGKDVYVEKPMTLTIDEGIAVCEAVKRTGRVVQVGTQQRSEYKGIFLKAVAIAQLGILGNKLTASVYIPSSYRGATEVFPVTEAPDSLLWDQWCGPVQKFPYTAERAHAQWRLWVETGHGPLTDWGAHHIDIAQWALGVDQTGPVKIRGNGTFPLGREKTLAAILGQNTDSPLPNSFSTVMDYSAELTFKNGNVIKIDGKRNRPDNLPGQNGLLLEGENGNIWVSREGRAFEFEGNLADEINNNKVLKQQIDDKVIELYKGRVPAWMDAELIGDIVPTAHMENFVNSVKDRADPISDVFTHHRANSSAILAHSSMILNRTLEWNPEKQKFVGDNEANKLLSREYRAPYSIKSR